jgi:hypothetical protein
VIFAFLPSNGVTDVFGFELKLLIGIGSFGIPALAAFFWSQRKRVSASGIEQAAEAYPD